MELEPSDDEIKKHALFEYGLGKIETKKHGTVSGRDYMKMVKLATLLKEAKRNKFGVEVVINHKDEGLLKDVLNYHLSPPNDKNIEYQNDLQYEFENYVYFKYDYQISV